MRCEEFVPDNESINGISDGFYFEGRYSGRYTKTHELFPSILPYRVSGPGIFILADLCER